MRSHHHSHSHHRHGRSWRHWRPTPLGRYVRSRLHRRLFAWFGASILLTALVMGAVISLLARVTDTGWRHQLEGLKTFTAHQFERTWEDSVARGELIAGITRDLEMKVCLIDAEGRALPGSAPRCDGPLLEVPVTRAGKVLGTVRLSHAHRAQSHLYFFIPVLAAICVLWAASGRIARRLARPLGELSSVVQDIGAGKLSARASTSCQQSDEIGVVAEAVNEMAARIEKQMADQRELLAAVSHELRTPLARIRLVTELARDGGATVKTFDDLDREVVEIDALVGELLANSRIDFAALVVRELSVVDIAARALERCGVGAEKLVVEPGVKTVRADATLLARALANLIENARKHGGGLEQLVVTSREGQLAFEALDAGPGIPAGDAARIFEPFHRRADGKERGEGSLGLGLALVKRIALAHGGTAYAQNRPEGGARVGLQLPT